MAVHTRLVLATIYTLWAAPAGAGDLHAKVQPDSLATLKAIMPGYALSVHRIENALWRDDYATVAAEARAILKHVPVSKSERQRIIGTLHDDTGWFKQADARVHKAALAMAVAADARRPPEILRALGEMHAACIGCHTAFRARLRTP